jgi:hypothetical protein
MKFNVLIIISLVIGNCSFSQCQNITYRSSDKENFTQADTMHFTVTNNCKMRKFVIFSLEYLNSNSWQEVDFDIFVESLKGMKMIELLPKHKKEFIFDIKNIDSVLFEGSGKVQFRIIGNLYSNDKVEISETSTIKTFFVKN